MKSCFLLLLLASFTSFAQKGNLSHALDIVIPQGTFTASAGTGWGSSFRYEYYLSPKFSVTGMVGYISFAQVTQQITTPSTMTLSIKSEMIPVQFGAKLYLFNENLHTKKGLYISGEAGFNVLWGSIKLNGVDETPPNESDFSYAGGIGYMIKKFDLSVRQQFVTSSPTGANGSKSVNYLNFRLAWLLFTKKKQ